MLCISSATAHAFDWPQILGPERNGIAPRGEKLAEQWPQSGPLTVWEVEVGHAYSGVVVADGLCFVFQRDKGKEFVSALDAMTGKEVWKSAGDVSTFYPQVGGGDGPLCVPIVTGDHVVTFGAQGRLSCLNAKTGTKLWSRETHTDFRALEGYFGAGSTPIVVGEKVIVNVGGRREKSGIVAFDLKTGETVWQKTEESASYSSPVRVDIEGVTMVLMITRYQCMLLDPETGNARFQFRFGQRGPTVNGATPVTNNGKLFVTSAYGIGSKYVEFDLFQHKTIWESENIGSQYCTPIILGDVMYVIDGRDDVPPADLKCVDITTGKLLWTEQNFGYGTLIQADGKLLAVKTNGDIMLIEASPEKYRRLAKAKALKGTIRALPALANGMLYVRNQSTLKCIKVGP